MKPSPFPTVPRFAIAAAALVLAVTPLAGQPERPNLVVIMADDLGYADLGGVWGGKARTPHLDQLAREGLRFTDFHSSGPVCTPTRAALMTGRYPGRLGIVKAFNHPFTFDGWQDKGIAADHNADEITIATYLRRAGYATGIFGKWHLGKNVQANPVRHGFDEFRGLTCGCGDYFSKLTRFGEPDWWHNDTLEFQEGYATRVIADNAVDFIERHARRPFFLYVPYNAIHFPWQDPDDEDETTRRPGEVVGTPGAVTTKVGPNVAADIPTVVRNMIEEIDRGVGLMVDALRRHGLAERTMVIFMSDNGGYTNYPYRGTPTVVSSNGPFRGAKGQVYEGGHRVPALAWWPGTIRAGSVTDATAVTMDLVPTMLDLAGVPLPAPDGPNALDGVSLVRLLLQGERLPARAIFWQSAPRDGKVRWAARLGPWKLVDDELYHLGHDPGESRDVAAQHPEIVRELSARRDAWRQDVEHSSRT